MQRFFNPTECMPVNLGSRQIPVEEIRRDPFRGPQFFKSKWTEYVMTVHQVVGAAALQHGFG